MTLEGDLRELSPGEVLQLLATGRRSGRLEVDAPVLGARAVVLLHDGMIRGVELHRADGRDPFPGDGEEALLDVLRWRLGWFAFVPTPADAPPAGALRLVTERLLMEGARRAEVWCRIGDRVPHLGVVPCFVEVEPTTLPLLHLSPAQWELLTRVDGERDLHALARSLGRDPMDVAEEVHGLIGMGLLRLEPPGRAAALRPTPPVAAMPVPCGVTADGDLWVPGPEDGYLVDGDAVGPGDGHDSLFDPLQPQGGAVAHAARGDAAARRGDLLAALAAWSEALREGDPPLDPSHADRVREAVALAARLHALLHALPDDAPVA